MYKEMIPLILLEDNAFFLSKTDDSGRKQFLRLASKGIVFAGEGLVTSANFSIPSVISKDLKE